jgi:hypothetical protein
MYGVATQFSDECSYSGSILVNTDVGAKDTEKRIGGIVGAGNTANGKATSCSNTGTIKVCKELSETDTDKTKTTIAGIAATGGHAFSCDECTFDGTIVAPGDHQERVLAIVGLVYAEGRVTNCKVDGYITKGSKIIDLTTDNFFDYIYLSGVPADWGTQEKPYEGNYGVEYDGGGSIE